MMRKGLLWVVVAFWISVILSIVAMKLVLEPLEHAAIFAWPSLRGDTNFTFVLELSDRLLLFFLLSGAIMFLATRSVTSPVDWLRSAAQKLATGELTTRVDIPQSQPKPATELERLIKDFNQMAERVEELVRSQRQLLANVSHELRSPLARLALTVDLLRQFPEDREDHLARFESELGKLNELIERLLTLSRLESSTASLKADVFDLADLTTEVISDVQFEASARGCSVRCIRLEHCPTRGDQALLSSAIENILRNAVQYSDEGTTIFVEVICNKVESSVKVTDQGPGLSEKELACIFQPFFRGTEASARRSDGHGLGLAIACKAVELHGGTILAQNVTSGLAVTIRLPQMSAIHAIS